MNKKNFREEFEEKEDRILKESIKEYEKYRKKTIGKYKKRKRHKRFFILFNISLILLLCVGFVAFSIYENQKDNINQAIQLGYDKIATIKDDTFHTQYNSVLLDKDGNVLKQFKGREYIYGTYDEINKNLLDATVAIEDERFYDHKGIDLKGIVRAAYYTIVKHNTQGGSTITVQLAKNIFMSEVMTQKSIYRKITEWVIAQELEKRYSKNEILEFYVNNINYGNGCYSVETASNYYFQKSTKELSLAECALLAGIPNNPSLYNPLENPENAIKRRNVILNKMLNLGIINEEECNQAKTEELNLNKKEIYIDNTVTGYAETFAMHKATQEMMKVKGFLFKYTFKNNEEKETYNENYSEMYQECYLELIHGGYQISTAIDKEKQNKLQEIVDNSMKKYTELQSDGLYEKQATATVIDNSTGLVIAIVGGRSQEKNDYNRAVFSARQPGSAIKPLVAYTPAYEKGYYPDMIMIDEEVEKGPKNYYEGYKGEVTLRYATEISINTIPYCLVRDIGTSNCLKYLTNMHFSHLDNEDYLSPIVAVGGFTNGVTNVEMASGFATLANNGKYIEPTNVTEIKKISNGENVYENKQAKITVYNSGATYLTTDVLKGVLCSEEGTAHEVQLTYPYQAGKTGTTNDYKDVWMCGYTPYYSMAVWVGDDYPKKQEGVVEQKYIWHDYMEYLHQGLTIKKWKQPQNVYSEDGILKLKTDTTLENLIKNRQEMEESRKLAEEQAQQNRLIELDYRLLYGLTEEEELKRENIVDTLITSLENFEYTSLAQKENLHTLYQKIEESLEDVKRLTKYNELNQRYQEIKNTLDKIEEDLTIEENARINLEQAKASLNTYKTNLANIVDLSLYREIEREYIKNIISQALTDMDSAVSIAELDSIYNNAIYNINQYYTEAELIQKENQELIEKKQTAINSLNNYVFSYDYRDEEWNEISTLIKNATSEINEVSYQNIDNIDIIVSNCKIKIDNIPLKNSFTPETTTPSQTSEEYQITEPQIEIPETTIRNSDDNLDDLINSMS